MRTMHATASDLPLIGSPIQECHGLNIIREVVLISSRVQLALADPSDTRIQEHLA